MALTTEPPLGRRQGVLAAGFLIPPGQHLIVAFQEQQGIVPALALELVQAFGQVVEQLAAAGVDDDGHPGQGFLRLQAQVGKFGEQFGGHIVHAIKPDVLQRVHRAGFSRAGQAGYYHKFHRRLLLSCRLPKILQ